MVITGAGCRSVEGCRRMARPQGRHDDDVACAFFFDVYWGQLHCHLQRLCFQLNLLK